MKKLISLCLVLSFVFCLLISCQPTGNESSESGQNSTPVSSAPLDITAEEMAQAVMATVTMPEMVAGSQRVISSYYDFAVVTECEDYACYLTSSGATADEVGIFVFKSENDAKEAVKKMEKRRDDQITSFTGYVDTEVPRLQNAKIGTVGRVAYYIVTSDPTAGVTALEGKLK